MSADVIPLPVFRVERSRDGTAEMTRFRCELNAKTFILLQRRAAEWNCDVGFAASAILGEFLQSKKR